MKKILFSLITITAVSAAVFGFSQAFFRDTETSTGNKFVVGKFNLKVGSQCTYNGEVVASCNWLTPKDLNGEIFFNFDDIKPGDKGENTIGLQVDNNDAWMCAEIANLVSDDNGCDKPESDVDQTCGPGQGELQDNLKFTVWKDADCDNVLDQESVPGYCTTTDPDNQTYCSGFFDKQGCDTAEHFDCDWIEAQPAETVLVDNQSASNLLWPIADSTTGAGPLEGDKKYCLGVSWNVPIETTNIIQTDSLVGDITFSAIQSRNMDDFKCSGLHTWVKPTNYTDAAGTWASEELIYNGIGSPYGGTINIPVTSWSDFLELNLPAATNSNQVRYYIPFCSGTVCPPVNQIDVDVFRNGVWTDVYQGTFNTLVWETKPFIAGSVTKARIRFYNSDTFFKGSRWIDEFEFYANN